MPPATLSAPVGRRTNGKEDFKKSSAKEVVIKKNATPEELGRATVGAEGVLKSTESEVADREHDRADRGRSDNPGRVHEFAARDRERAVAAVAEARQRGSGVGLAEGSL